VAGARTPAAVSKVDVRDGAVCAPCSQSQQIIFEIGKFEEQETVSLLNHPITKFPTYPIFLHPFAATAPSSVTVTSVPLAAPANCAAMPRFTTISR
jgi:hypothetical protein